MTKSKFHSQRVKQKNKWYACFDCCKTLNTAKKKRNYKICDFCTTHHYKIGILPLRKKKKETKNNFSCTEDIHKFLANIS